MGGATPLRSLPCKAKGGKLAGCPRMSPEDAALLQGFPRAFKFHGTSTVSRYRQIGNAVPPPLACAVVKQVVTAIDWNLP